MKNTLRFLITFVMTAACFCPLAAADDTHSQPGPDAVQPILDRLAKMEFSVQQAWLRRLEERANRAARIALDPEQAERERLRIRDLLHRKTVSWQVLREAIGAADSLERKSVERLAERYRDQVSAVFGRWPDEARRRLVAWETAHRNWTAAGGDFERQDRLIDWLESAISSVDAGSIAAIPTPPTAVKREDAPRESSPSPPAPLPKGEGRMTLPSPPAVVPKGEGRMTLPSPPAVVPEGEGRMAQRPERGPISLPIETQVSPPAPVRPLPSVRPAGESPTEKVRVDADELTVRIAGCNLAFRELEAELDEKGPWNAGRIEPLANRLKILVVRRGDLDLFRDLLPDEQRAKTAKLESSKTAIAQLGARIFEARRAASAPDFQGSEAERRLELDRLENLSRRLAEAAEK